MNGGGFGVEGPNLAEAFDEAVGLDTSGEGVITPDSVDFGAPRVRFKWSTPDGDRMIAHMARVSNPSASLDDPSWRLINFLLRKHHWSPFEMASMCLEIHTERDISAQILRHRSFSFQEFSTRYAAVEELRWSSECRWQDPKNRQGSFTAEHLRAMADPDDLGALDLNLEATVAYFDAVINETRVRSMEAYQELLGRGVAKEVARRILPIGLMPTTMYMTGTVRSWLHYCSERTKPEVQKEHRLIAMGCLEHLTHAYPATVLAACQNELFELSAEDANTLGSWLDAAGVEE